MTDVCTQASLHLLEDKWDDSIAESLDGPDLLRYRSNLLGSDLRITNFGGGNTSSKLQQIDPLDGETKTVLWIKGSGGDLGSIGRSGFATLYLDKLLALEKLYRGVGHEDEMAEYYPLLRFGTNPVATSIDTPLHGYLPFPHVDHLHPDWGIALAAAANGKERMEEFNEKFGHRLAWLPWQRPGFELGLMLRHAVDEAPDCDGVVLGGHGLFTWGQTQHECYRNTITIIDQLGQFLEQYGAGKKGLRFGGARASARSDRRAIAASLMPRLRGAVSNQRRLLGSYTDTPQVLEFVNSLHAGKLAYMGTSCPDHFIRTKIRPLFVPWDPAGNPAELPALFAAALETYRGEYSDYYNRHALPDSPAQRDSSPAVILVPGIGMFSFGKSRTESRITGEFYVNAIGVMGGAGALSDGASPADIPQASARIPPSQFTVYENYVALPQSEAFRIEYWSLEEAKIRRQPSEKQLSRQIALVVGGASGIGREVARLAAERGAHVMVADRDLAGAEAVMREIQAAYGAETADFCIIDIRDRASIRSVLETTILRYGGLDMLINTAALFPSSPDGVITDAQWALTLEVNVTANFLLADEARSLFDTQGLETSIVLTSSANAVVPKRGSEAYDVSKAAVSHLVRELAVSMAPKVRVNGVSPATVVKGSTMFPRDRVIASLKKYNLPFNDSESDEELREILARFYAARTLTHHPIDPKDCAEAILFLVGPLSRCTTGHLIPVDGGLTEAYLR